ncbi:Peptidase S54 rhomboid [Gracilaria domingensis]|nr:Peptidase S54 rhomboid [Gracilaria domingensis]
MVRNFDLSSDALKKNRAHVVLTSVFTHLDAKHLIRNFLLAWVSAQACCRFLNSWEIAVLYLSWRIVGIATTAALASLLRKPQYRASCMGGSAAVFSLFSFYWSTLGNESSSSGYMLTDIAMRVAIFKELIGVAVYLRHGYTGQGVWSVRVGHVAHMAEIVNGILASRLGNISRSSAADPCAIVLLVENSTCYPRSRQQTSNLIDPSKPSAQLQKFKDV